MIKISEVVSDMLHSDENAMESLRAGILNLSAYAEKIRPTVEKRLYKEVRRGSIVTALSRLSSHMVQIPPLRALVHMEDISIKSPLCELSYELSQEILRNVSKLTTKYARKGFFTVTQGVGELTLIIPQSLKDQAVQVIAQTPKGQYDNLAAVTARFIEDQYIEVPNMIYTMVATLASRRINLIEVVSTFTEISFIVRQQDLKSTIEILKDNFLT